MLASLASQPAGRVALSLRDGADTLSPDSLPMLPDSLPSLPDSLPLLPNDSLPLLPDSLPLLPDSLPLLPDSMPRQAYTILPDSVPTDTVPSDTVPQSKNALDMPVTYSAEDSITFDYKRSRAHLYGDSKVQYQNLELEAELIQIAIDSSLVHATSRTDSTGAVIGKPLFKQGSDEYEPDSISYNFKSRKAYISNVYTQQGEGYMKGLDGKRDSVGTMYVQKAYYCTQTGLIASKTCRTKAEGWFKTSQLGHVCNH